MDARVRQKATNSVAARSEKAWDRNTGQRELKYRHAYRSSTSTGLSGVRRDAAREKSCNTRPATAGRPHQAHRGGGQAEKGGLIGDADSKRLWQRTAGCSKVLGVRIRRAGLPGTGLRVTV